MEKKKEKDRVNDGAAKSSDVVRNFPLGEVHDGNYVHVSWTIFAYYKFPKTEG